MTRIIKNSTPGKERNHLSKAIVVTIREFMRQTEPDNNTRDMIAFIILALREIGDGIDKSVIAWEKRGYWVKADKYRMEWAWVMPFEQDLIRYFKSDDWGQIAGKLVDLMGRFSSIKVSDKHRMGKPWVGAYKEYLSVK
ncbi:hypothetical protein JR338_03455 [Chloroflexota bacterium]|nr:hypothetical protein JR338_03455 [Chloroflexota bacterium]